MTDDELALFDMLMRKHSVAANDLAGAAICRALAKALAADKVDPSAVNGLLALLPRPVTGQRLDLARMSDAALAEMEANLIESGATVEDDGVSELLSLNARLVAQIRDQDAMIAGWELSHAAEIASAKARAVDAERRLLELEATAKASALVPVTVPDMPAVETTPSPSPDNVVPLPVKSPFSGLASALSGTDGGGGGPGILSSGSEYSA